MASRIIGIQMISAFSRSYGLVRQARTQAAKLGEPVEAAVECEVRYMKSKPSVFRALNKKP